MAMNIIEIPNNWTTTMASDKFDLPAVLLLLPGSAPEIMATEDTVGAGSGAVVIAAGAPMVVSGSVVVLLVPLTAPPIIGVVVVADNRMGAPVTTAVVASTGATVGGVATLLIGKKGVSAGALVSRVGAFVVGTPVANATIGVSVGGAAIGASVTVTMGLPPATSQQLSANTA
jgi:hypothetical protein